MDDLAAHEAERVRTALEAAGIAHRHLPSRSPDLSPIEQAWSELEGRLRTGAARSLDALEAAPGPALDAIAAEDARGWFRLAGHPAPD